MDEILNAVERPLGRFRESGFIPGVIYGDFFAAAKPIKLEAGPLQKLISRHGSNAKVKINLDNDHKSGFIREVQRDAISKLITHVDVQIVSQNHEVKMNIPIIFRNENILADKHLQLQIIKPAVSITGTMNVIPEGILVDLIDMGAGDLLTRDQLLLDSRLIINDKEDTVYAAVVSEPIEEPTQTNIVH